LEPRGSYTGASDAPSSNASIGALIRPSGTGRKKEKGGEVRGERAGRPKAVDEVTFHERQPIPPVEGGANSKVMEGVVSRTARARDALKRAE